MPPTFRFKRTFAFGKSPSAASTDDSQKGTLRELAEKIDAEKESAAGGGEPAAALKQPAINEDDLRAPVSRTPPPQVREAAPSVTPLLDGVTDVIPFATPPPPPPPASTSGSSDMDLEEGEAQDSAAAPTTPSAPYPWERVNRQIRSPLMRLHNEIVTFCRSMEPTTSETDSRQAAVDEIGGYVREIWPAAQIAVFGSFATGLFLPTSDIDLVVLDTRHNNVQAALKALAEVFARRQAADNMQVIAKAKVPIIKFEHRPSGLKFDISFDVANGPEAADCVLRLVREWPPMRALVTILKIFLQQRDMNEVYSGGIGSYALLVMVAAFLQLHASRHPVAGRSRRAAPLEMNLGVLLVDFLRMYGRALNPAEVGVDCAGLGAFYNKREAGLHQGGDRGFMMSAKDPADPSNDLCRGSYNIMRLRGAFDHAYQALTQLAHDGSKCMLGKILRLDSVIAARLVFPHEELFAGVEPRGRASKRERSPKGEGGRSAGDSTHPGGGGRWRHGGSSSPPPRSKRHRRGSPQEEDANGGGRGAPPPGAQLSRSRAMHQRAQPPGAQLSRSRAGSRGVGSSLSAGATTFTPGRDGAGRRSTPPGRDSTYGHVRSNRHTRFD